MRKEVVLIFDIGKTNKKILLFDRELNIVLEEETRFEEISDDEGHPCDDIENLEAWMLEACHRYVADETLHVKGINFTTYGATLMYLDKEGKRLTPVYNYLKNMPGGVVEPLYESHGGEDEFCRRTASPAMGMLNSGLQALWLKKKKPELYAKVESILHFPQYLSSLLTGQIASEHTSIGCHTALWDFDQMDYHPWVKELGVRLPDPEKVENTYPSRIFHREVPVGIGIHDSSSSLVPYFMNSREDFILLSTGTWCISMNPFNSEPLTSDQLRNDCLTYMSIQQKPVKSARLFMGHIHDVNVEALNRLFGVEKDAYKQVGLDEDLLQTLLDNGSGRVFFRNGIPDDYLENNIAKEQFEDFEEAYHQLMIDLAELTANSIKLVIPKEDTTQSLYISGGFAKNPIFLKLIAKHFPDKNVYTSEVANATSLGAAMILWKSIDPGFNPRVDLGLQ